MKSFIIVLAVVLSGCSSMHSADNLIKHFSKEKNAVFVNAGKLEMGSLKNLAGVSESMQLLSGITSAQVLVLKDCADDVKQRFSGEISSLKADGYELLVKVKKDDMNKHMQVEVLLKSKKDEINELLVVVTGDYPVLARIAGNMKRSDIQQLVDSMNKNKGKR
jgi:hypothetical protein